MRCSVLFVFFFFKQKTAYEMRISDWSSDVCSSDLIAASARRADDIVGRIRGMAAKQPPELVPLNLNEVVQESLLFVRHEVDTRAIRVTASYAKGLKPVTGDRIQLQQVVVNLLINAIQAVEADRKRTE